MSTSRLREQLKDWGEKGSEGQREGLQPLWLSGMRVLRSSDDPVKTPVSGEMGLRGRTWQGGPCKSFIKQRKQKLVTGGDRIC